MPQSSKACSNEKIAPVVASDKTPNKFCEEAAEVSLMRRLVVVVVVVVVAAGKIDGVVVVAATRPCVRNEGGTNACDGVKATANKTRAPMATESLCLVSIMICYLEETTGAERFGPVFG